MNVVEVSKLLGYESIETTIQYISTSSEPIHLIVISRKGSDLFEYRMAKK